MAVSASQELANGHGRSPIHRLRLA
jgi:hypothetical protein